MDIVQAIGWASHAIWNAIVEIWRGFVRFFDVVVAWGQKVYSRFLSKLRQGWRMYYVEVDASRIPPSVVPTSQLQGAKKVHLGVLSDSSGVPHQVDEIFIPTAVDAETRQNLREGNGAIELVL